MNRRIAVISPYAPPADGISDHSAQLVLAWQQEGYEVRVFAPSFRLIGRRRPDEAGTNVFRVFGALPRRSTVAQIVDFDPDFVFVQFAVPALHRSLLSTIAAIRSLRRSGRSVVVAFHEVSRDHSRLKWIAEALYGAVRSTSSTWLTFSQSESAALEKLSFTNVHQLPLGCPPVYRRAKAESRSRSASEIVDESSAIIAAFGFITFSKGTDLLITAVGQLKSSGFNVLLKIAGTVRHRRSIFKWFERKDRKYLRSIQAQVLRNGLTQQTEFIGHVPGEEVAKFLNEVDAVVFPYRSATQSAAAAQALSAGAAIIASQTPGLGDSLGDAARYFNHNDPEALANAIRELLLSEKEPQRLRSRAIAKATLEQHAIVAAAIARLAGPRSDRERGDS